MSERVPEGWSALNLGDICAVSGGSAFKEKYQGNRNGDYPFIKVSDMNVAGNERYITHSTNWISEDVRKDAKIKLFPKNSIVFAKVGAALLLNRRRILLRDTAIDNNMMAAIPSESDFNYLYFLLQSIDFGGFVQSGAVPSVNQSQIDSIPIIAPQKPEQQKIASILTSVDEVIEKTESQISKLQDLKKAMMQELLTKGIGHAEFKDSPVGRIPVGWKYEAVGDLIESYSYGPRFNAKNYDSNGNVKTIRGTDVSANGTIKYKQVPLALLDASTVTKHELLESDIIMITTADCGVTAVFHKQAIPFICSAYAIRLRPTQEINPYYFAFYMQTDAALRTVESYVRKGTVANLPGSDVLKMALPLPPQVEQEKIVAALSSVDRKIDRSRKRLSKFQSSKKALMQDLLTGKVRVKTD